MFYRDELTKLLKDEKNLVNRMYLNEILLQLKRYESALANESDSDRYFEKIADAMTSFTTHLENPKYKYNKITQNGFKRSSPILSAIYLDDFIESIMRRQKIIKNRGVVWGKQPFSMNMRYKFTSFNDIEKDLTFEQKKSHYVLQLSQKLDFQYRVAGKRAFSKHEVTLPLITIYTYKNLVEEELIRIGYYAEKAKKTLEKAKTIVICETIDGNFDIDAKCHHIDTIYVLRKQRLQKKQNIIHSNVIKVMYEDLVHYLYNYEDEEKLIREEGILFLG